MVGTFVFGALVGLVIGAEVTTRWYSDIAREIKRLDREIAGDKLAEARELKQAEALRLIRQNEQEASK